MGVWSYHHRRLAATAGALVLFLFVAGAMQYSVKKFLVALTLGRIVRYSVLGYLGARYGRHVLTIIARQVHPVLVAVIGLIAVGLTALIFHFARKGKK